MRDAALITDHALVRYLERAAGIDVERIKADMLTAGRARLVRSIQHGKVKCPELGIVLVVCSGVVVSVLPIRELSGASAAQARAAFTAHYLADQEFTRLLRTSDLAAAAAAADR